MNRLELSILTALMLFKYREKCWEQWYHSNGKPSKLEPTKSYYRNEKISIKLDPYSTSRKSFYNEGLQKASYIGKWHISF